MSININLNLDRLFSGKDVFEKYYNYITLNMIDYNNNTFLLNIEQTPLIPIVLKGELIDDQYTEIVNEYIKIMLGFSLQKDKRNKQINIYEIQKHLENGINLEIEINPLARSLFITPLHFYEEFYKIKSHLQSGIRYSFIGKDEVYLEVLRIRIAAEIYQSMGLEW